MAKGPLSLLAYSQDDTIKLDEGKLTLLDNQILQTTGSVRLKAEFPNKTHRLWPGELINVWLLLDTRHDGLTVPAAAVQQGQQGAFSYVIKPDNTVQVAARHGRADQPRAGAGRFRPGGQRAGRHRRAIQAAGRQPGNHPPRQGGGAGRGPERRADADPMNLSAPFIARPIATALMMVGLLLGGLAAYPLLPVAALPNINYPTLQVTAQLPGADPRTMASSVGDTARIAVRPDSGPHPDDLGERARLYPSHPAVRPEPPRSTARPPTRCRRSTRPARNCRSTCRTRRPSGR